MKLKIISDGTVSGTSVVNAETGTPIEDITHITWQLSVSGGVADAMIELRRLPVELIGTTEMEPVELLETTEAEGEQP